MQTTAVGGKNGDYRKSISFADNIQPKKLDEGYVDSNF